MIRVFWSGASANAVTNMHLYFIAVLVMLDSGVNSLSDAGNPFLLPRLILALLFFFFLPSRSQLEHKFLALHRSSLGSSPRESFAMNFRKPQGSTKNGEPNAC